MLQNLNAHKNHKMEMGVGVHSDEILSLIDHKESKYGQNRLVDEKAEEKVVHGVPVSQGITDGYAVIIKTPEDLQRINTDSIMICHRMSPAYSIAFQTVRGIVSEHGGMISTTATVARENGLPAVTGIRSARQIISDGDLIGIDGTNGCVQINVKAKLYG